VFEPGVHRMEQLDGDHDQRLLGRFALGLLASLADEAQEAATISRIGLSLPDLPL
jgi:hypothetical protein